MIAEPYICIKGQKAGQIEWCEYPRPATKSLTLEHLDGKDYIATDRDECSWQLYTNFEREKLRELKIVKAAYCGFRAITVSCVDCYWVLLSRLDCANRKCKFPWQTFEGDRKGEKQHCHYYGSVDLIEYSPSDYTNDSESSRLLKRAEFLKAVCEKEGVEWLPKPLNETHTTDPMCDESFYNGPVFCGKKHDQCNEKNCTHCAYAKKILINSGWEIIQKRLEEELHKPGVPFAEISPESAKTAKELCERIRKENAKWEKMNQLIEWATGLNLRDL